MAIKLTKAQIEVLERLDADEPRYLDRRRAPSIGVLFRAGLISRPGLDHNYTITPAGREALKEGRP